MSEVIILYTTKGEVIEKILALHKVDKLKTRILLKNNPTKYRYSELVQFNKGNDFSFIWQTKELRYSSNNKLYFVQIDKYGIVYKEGKFWSLKKTAPQIKLLTAGNIFFGFPSSSCNVIQEIIINKFPFLRFLFEFRNQFPDLSFNSIIKHKLFNYKDAMRYYYKTNIITAKFLKEKFINQKLYNYYKKHCINFNENLNIELISRENKLLFEDSIRLADVVGAKVNCKWSVDRLTKEHDNWSKIITNVICEESDRPINIHKQFKDFAEFSGYQLITTTKELALEGKRQSHCVATYLTYIEEGKSAIFHIKGYTLEVKNSISKLNINQFRGFGNVQAPKELQEQVQNKINLFNERPNSNTYARIPSPDDFSMW